MQSTNSNFPQQSIQSSTDTNNSSQECQEILTLEDLIKILEKLDNYQQKK
jgi:hypothetical protein